MFFQNLHDRIMQVAFFASSQFKAYKASPKLYLSVLALVLLGFVTIVSFFFDFGSGLEMNDQIEDELETLSVDRGSEDIILEKIAAHEFDSFDFGQFELTMEDIIDIMSEVKASKEKRATKYCYQYYWETWCVCSYKTVENGLHWDWSAGGLVNGPHEVTKSTSWDEEKSEEDIKGTDPNAHDFTWGWHSGYRYTDGLTTKKPGIWPPAVQHDEYKEPDLVIDNSIETDDQYSVDWQSIYALCVMASQEQSAEWEDDYSLDVEEEKIDLRIDPDTIEKAIDAFKYEFTYAFDGSTGKNMKKTSEWKELEAKYLDENGNPTEEAYRIFAIRKDRIKSLIKGEPRWICKQIKHEVQEKRLSWDNSIGGSSIEKLTYVGESKGDWGWQGSGAEVYKRTLRKIPASSLLGVSNGYMAVGMKADANTFDVAHGCLVGADKYKNFKQYVDGDDSVHEGSGLTNLDGNCKYKDNKEFSDGIYEYNPDTFYKTCCTIVNQFDWEYFLLILETLPDETGGKILEKYEKMYAEWKASSEHGAVFRPLDADEFEYMNNFSNPANIGDKKVIFGSERKDKILNGGDYFIPDLDEYSSDAGSKRSLLVPDNLSLEQIKMLLDGFSPIAGRSTSLFHDTSVAEKLYEWQESHPDASVLGLLALACCESGYGTSPLSYDYWNFIGWGAFDSDPRGGESKHGNFKAISESVGDALIQNFDKIYNNYLTKGQDSYHTMRWNGGVHQYCTSLTWEFTNANIRAQMEKFLGIYVPTEADTEEYNPVEHIQLIDVGDRAEAIANFRSPLGADGLYTVTSTFGYRNIENQVHGASKNHKGVDIAPCGASKDDTEIYVYAVADGTLEINKWGEGAGYYVAINHGGGVVTKYMHLAERGCGTGVYFYDYAQGKDVESCLEPGSSIKRGQIIGIMGSTGVSGGRHLHFQLEVDGTPVDPQAYTGNNWNISEW